MADTMSDDQKDIEIQKLKDQLWYMTTLNDNGRRFLADAQADGMKQLEEIGGLQKERAALSTKLEQARGLVARVDAFLAHLDFPYTEGIRGEFLRFLNNSAPSEAQREDKQ
jgi:hypothetical protein